MELDKRIAKSKTYIDCFETELAKKFIGKECYLSNDVASFANVDCLYKAVLKEVDEEAINPYTLENTRWRHSSNFILPCEWVKPEESEKKYRPYTVMEFIKEYPLGSHLYFRPKDKLIEMHRLIDGYNDCLNGAGTLFMCGAMYSMRELYDNYEICVNGEWLPFGVIDE